MKFRVFVAILIAVSSMPAWANEASFCEIPPQQAGVSRITIDASTGRVTGASKYRLRDEAEILVFNKNPFVYSYKLDVHATTIEEPNIATFLGFVAPSITLEEPKPPAGDHATSLIPRASVPKNVDCDTTELDRLQKIYDTLGTTRETLEADIKKLAAEHNNTAAAFTEAQTVLNNPHGTCAALVTTSTVIRKTLDAFKPDYEAVEKRIASIEARAQILLEDINSYEALHPLCKSKVDPFRDRAELLSKSAPDTWRANLTKLKVAKEKLDTAAKTVGDVLDQGASAFIETYSVGSFTQPTNVAIKLSRKEVASKADFAPIVDRTVNFGGQARFSIGIGLASSAIDRTQYTRVQGFANDRLGNPVLQDNQPLFTTVVGTTERSSSRVSPMLMMHGRVIDWSVASLQLSLGLTAKNDNKGLDVEYLVGPTLGLIEDRLFFTVGAYAGRVQHLEGNLFVGAAVPKDLAEIPVRKDLNWHLGFALTFKAR